MKTTFRFPVLFSIIFLLTFSSCNTTVIPETPSPTLIPTATPAPTATVAPTATPTPTVTPTPTATPAPTATPIPTATPAPTATVAPTVTPAPTATPTPTATPVPTVTVAPSATPTPTAIPSGLPELTYKENIIMEGSVLSSEEEVNRFLLSMALNNYYMFGILVDDISLLRSANEYMDLIPEILVLEFDSLTKYHNGYYLTVSNMVTTQPDPALTYALRTGDTSVLNTKGQLAYRKLFSIAEELKLKELSDIDAIIAVHDYLILSTAYDSITAASGESGPAHFAEGLLLNNLAVCSGYASAFRLLLSFAGINCEYIFTESHAWNLVELDGEWYHIDVTWDDPVPDQPGIVNYKHFMMTSEEISALDQHKNWSCECTLTHNANDNSYRLYPYRDYICSDEENAVRLIRQQADSKVITLVFPVTETLTEDSMLQLVFETLQLSGNITYYPSEHLSNNYYLLRIILQ